MAAVSRGPCRAGGTDSHTGPTAVLGIGSRALICSRTAVLIRPGTPKAAGAASSTAATAGGGCIRILSIHASPFRSNGNRYPLQNASLLVAWGVHAIIDREVPADQVGTHGRVLSGQDLGFIGCAGLVLAVIDAGNAGIADPGTIGFVDRLGPLATSAQVYSLHVSLLFAKNEETSL